LSAMSRHQVKNNRPQLRADPIRIFGYASR
jgi:hypothetical protein